MDLRFHCVESWGWKYKSGDGMEGIMKITIQDIAPGEEEEIIVRCRDLDEALLRMIYELKTRR